MMVLAGILFFQVAWAQKSWDGGAGTDQWSDAANWFPDGIPANTDDVVLNHQWISSAYQVSLPAGLQTVSLHSLLIAGNAETITLELPPGNTGNPGLSLTGTGDALTLQFNSVFINASGATAGSGLLLAGALRIENGARYVHQTARSNAALIDRISTVAGTETGIFEFNVPGTAGYTVSLTGNNFGSLYFRASAAGGTKSYSGSGSGTLTIRGNLLIDTGAQLTSTLTADWVLAGNLSLHGKFNLQPTTTGNTARSLRFVGPACRYTGNGSLILGANFRTLEVNRSSALTLQKSINLPLAGQSFICRGSLNPDTFYIDGPGLFILPDSGQLTIVHQAGISSDGINGPVRTQQRALSSMAAFIFEGRDLQTTGDGLPDTVSSLCMRNANGIQLSKNLYIRDSLQLLLGKISSTFPHLLTLGPCKVLSPASRYGPQNQGYERSFIEGPVGIHLTQGVPITVPLGTDTVFAPVTVLRTEPGSEIRILRYQPTPAPASGLSPPLIRVSDLEHWVWDQPLSAASSISLSVRPWSLHPGPTETPVSAGLSSQWTLLGNNSQGDGYYWIQAGQSAPGLSAMAPALADQNLILPLRLNAFQAWEENDGILLSWEAEEDNQPVRYTITRSENGSVFSDIGQISSSGKSRAVYRWADLHPLPIAYYQVIMGDRNGGIRSKVIRKIQGSRQVKIYPNPVDDLMTINFLTRSSKYEVEVVSLTGTVCKKFVCNTAITQVRVGDLKRGFYLLRLKYGKDWVTLPFTKN